MFDEFVNPDLHRSACSKEGLKNTKAIDFPTGGFTAILPVLNSIATSIISASLASEKSDVVRKFLISVLLNDFNAFRIYFRLVDIKINRCFRVNVSHYIFDFLCRFQSLAQHKN